MRRHTRLFVTLPTALGFLALYAATSPPMEWVALGTETLDLDVALDDNGEFAGEVLVQVPEMPSESEAFELQIRIVVMNEDASRSLRVEDTDNQPDAVRVREGLVSARFVDDRCEPGAPCTVAFPLVFSGKSNDTEPVQVLAEIGHYTAGPAGSPDLDVVVEWLPEGTVAE